MAAEDDFGDSPAPIQNRNQAFGGGMTGGQAMYSNSLAQESARFMAMVPRTIRSTGSPNAIGFKTYKDTMGGAFPTQNGLASDNYEVMKYNMRTGS